ncbi:outer membrane protein assembly factor BamD [Candidatus Pelagibacter sp.]|jgi:outer membrane protein assembly factor BamD|nr:outer membrane protein assembly factor BamD [Candidatus Pelagibacter sp.]
MKILYKLLILTSLILFSGCGNEKKEISKITELDQELEMINTYEDAMLSLEKGDYFFSSKKFLEAEMLFPQSKWAPKSALMSAYSNYMNNFYSEAVFDLERYMSTYPKDENMLYAHYLYAMCFYENIEDEKKDLAPLIKARTKFEFILKEYPDTDFALDASFKIDLINDIMASKEMYIGRHYIKKEKWVAAINRFKTVIEDYQTTIYVEEAIHRLVEIYYRIGLVEESKKYANLLGYNYLSSDWYTKSYKIFDQKIETPKIKIEKNSLLKKFKKLF